MLSFMTTALYAHPIMFYKSIVELLIQKLKKRMFNLSLIRLKASKKTSKKTLVKHLMDAMYSPPSS